MQKITLPIETLNKVLTYLSYQPYNQVSELVDEIRKNASKAGPSATDKSLELDSKDKEETMEAIK